MRIIMYKNGVFSYLLVFSFHLLVPQICMYNCMCIFLENLSYPSKSNGV
jgi:hypothetical protein